MNKLWMIALLAIVGCSEQANEPVQKVLYVADSLGGYREELNGPRFWETLGIECDCVNGRSLEDYGDIPEGYDIVFLALGTNDALESRDIDAFTLDLMQTVDYADTRVICVKPMDTIVPAHEYREAMDLACDETLYPPGFGIYPDDPDGIHITSTMDPLYVEMVGGVINSQ